MSPRTPPILADGAENKRDDAPPQPDPPGYFEGESMTRRRALSVTVQAIGGVAGLAVVLPAVGFSLAPVFDEEEEIWTPVGAPDDFEAATYKEAVITIVEDVGETGKTTAYIRRGSTELGEDPDEFVAVSNRCAHAGCPTRFVGAAGNFICPCHGGVYDFQGKVIGGAPGPAPARLPTPIRKGPGEGGPRPRRPPPPAP